MNYLSFEYPYLILLLLPLLYCLYKCKEYPKPRIFVHLQFLSSKTKLLKLEWIIKILVFVSLCIALTSPILIDKLSPLNRHGKEIVLALDASGSMNSSGFDDEDEISQGKRLTRFELSKKIIIEFIEKRVSDNIGIVIYGDFAFIASPITYEKKILSEMLEYINQGMAGQNTAIGDAIAQSVRAFKYSKASSKVIILLSDGEHNSGEVSPKEAMKYVQDSGIKVYTIGIGNKGEADAALLRKIASDGGGEFFLATNAKELQKIYEKIDDLESSKIKSSQYVLKEYFYWLVLLISATLVLFLLYKEVKR